MSDPRKKPYSDTKSPNDACDGYESELRLNAMILNTHRESNHGNNDCGGKDL
jgi:hypothetical protein